MQNAYPPSRVLVSQQCPGKFVLSETDPYIDVYTKEERDNIIGRYKTSNMFNGDCIRLDAISNGVGYLSMCTFYDFVCCNIAGFHNKDSIAWNKLRQHLVKYGELNSFEKVLAIKELPNILGTSTLLHDINNEYLLVERNTKVSIGSGALACSSSGSLNVEDLKHPNPIIGCAERELVEEMNLAVQLFAEGIIMPIQKMQPIALLTGVVQKPWREYVKYIRSAEDFNKENCRIYSVPKDKLLPIISLYHFTDAASFHIFFEAEGDKKKWKAVEYEPVKLSDYII